MWTEPGRESAGKEGPVEKRAVQAPSISLPRGGGAIRGMGEKFEANPVTGTGSMSAPTATGPGCSGFGPQLSVSYDSGAGNGPFGLGWSLSLPAITRKTDKGPPRYYDAEESDVFILSGSEDLVPLFNSDGGRFEDTDTAPGYTIHRYRPRLEGLFARIERWTNTTDGTNIFWRSISKDNILTVYGKDRNARIADPIDATRILTWLIHETRDDKGNEVLYEYKPEDGTGVDLAQAHERNRDDREDTRRAGNRCLKRIRYGNRVPSVDSARQRPRFLPIPPDPDTRWMFEVVFDYGEHDDLAPTPDDAGLWHRRNDPFSTYRAGFEVRTHRLCQRVLMFHHFPQEPGAGADCLVRSTGFTSSYEEDTANIKNPVFSQILSVTQTGYKRQNGGYLAKSLPPLVFTYTEAVIQEEVREVDSDSLENLPIGLDGAQYQWVDLDGEGLSGILTEQAGAWFYKRNLSPLPESNGSDSAKVAARFGPVELVSTKPALSLAAGHAQFMDFAGDGQPDVVALEGPVRGFYERTGELGWESFRPFRSFPNLDSCDANLKFIDLTVPNLGYGRFGAKVTMDNSPWFDFPDQFDQKRIRLADVDGSGLADILYLHGDGVRIYFNQSGNSCSDSQQLRVFPRLDDLVSIVPTDLLGNGTACLVWASPLPEDARRQKRYLDLMGGQKPHLMVNTVNILGAENRVQYAPFTKFYLTDKIGGKLWITRLPFSVHVVERGKGAARTR